MPTHRSGLHPRSRIMVVADFIVNGERRETREVAEQWLERASKNHENVLLADGNVYEIVNVQCSERDGRRHARVELMPPRFARGG